MIKSKIGKAGRVVILQTDAQATHYKQHQRKDSDLVIPIGPEAMYHAEENGWEVCNLGDLWSAEEYRQAGDESQSRIDSLIDALDAYSKRWNPGLGLEMGRYYALQLWIIVGQIHYNRFIADSIAKHLQPTSLLVYTKDIGQPFLELRPDPDCIFADVLLRSGCFGTGQIEIQRIAEKRKGNTLREKLVNRLPQKWIVRLREARDRWRIRSAGKSTYRLLMTGGGYDWFKIYRYDGFRDVFSLHILPRPIAAKVEINPPVELASILNGAVEQAGNTAYDLGGLASAIQSDLILFAGRNEKTKKQLERYDAVVTAVLTYPWESCIAHMAVKMGIPVVVWQHGEKGQTQDVTGLYSELFYATDYLAYAPAVQRQYQAWIGKNRLVNVDAVGSIGKSVVWRGGEAIVYATGKWFKTAVPFISKADPDRRLFDAHRTILGYLDTIAAERPVIFKANNTPGLNAVPYQYKNIRVDYATPFTVLLETAGVIILDTPGTTLVEACSTKVPIFVLGGRTEYRQEFLEIIRRRVVWCETPAELVTKLNSYLHTGLYEADVNDDAYLREYCAGSEPDKVVQQVKESLLCAIKRHG